MKQLLLTAFILSGIAVTANAQTESKLKTPEKQVVHKATAVKKPSSRTFAKKGDTEVLNGKRANRPVATPAPTVSKKKKLTKEMLRQKGITKESLKPE